MVRDSAERAGLASPEAEISPVSGGRPRLVSVRFTRAVNGRCRCQVTLEWPDARVHTGTAEGVYSPSAELRCAAEACLEALAAGMGGGAAGAALFELIGVKSVRAFDSDVLVASVARRDRLGGPRLVGSALGRRSPIPAAVRAVLQAVNRVVSKPRPVGGGARNDGAG